MLTPTISATVSRRLGVDLYGQPTYGTAMTTRVSVVSLGNSKVKSGKDNTASRTHAYEEARGAVLLMLPADEVSVGDRVTVSGLKLEVVGVQMRFDTAGRLDHREITLEMSAL